MGRFSLILVLLASIVGCRVGTTERNMDKFLQSIRFPDAKLLARFTPEPLPVAEDEILCWEERADGLLLFIAKVTKSGRVRATNNIYRGSDLSLATRQMFEGTLSSDQLSELKALLERQDTIAAAGGYRGNWTDASVKVSIATDVADYTYDGSGFLPTAVKEIGDLLNSVNLTPIVPGA